MYFHDSVAMLVWAYDFDLETGNVSNKRTLVDCRSSLGEPDGMVVEYVCYPVHFHIDESILTDIATTETSGLPCSAQTASWCSAARADA